MEYILHLLIFISIYILLSQSLSLTSGYAGLISLAHVGFYGIGAYTAAILSVNYSVPFLVTLPLAMLLSGLIAIIVSTISLRTVDDYFIIITLGIQVVIFSVMNNWQGLTRGPLGIPGIPSIKILGVSFDSKISFLLLSMFFVGIVWFLLNNITRSPFGRILIALSEDEIFTKSLGKDVYKAKIISFTISAMFASIAGVLYAHYISYIDPTSFTIHESIFILSIVIIGGMRNLWKVALAAAFLVLLPEVLRFVGMPNDVAANMRQIIYGVILVLVIFRSSDRIHKGKTAIEKTSKKSTVN
ncbi:MAG: branched-chain amino acid ABC transporter permease [Candidatus Scalindua rubra]|uniref:Ribose transport system permease protein RbsC n=1 Tax=Candidatus Scalindua brodae TaxID=237368 RepID=A0A0B0EFY2_9BACT|nr:MAG: Ribose transport system permease protein RbsC [Candidatus Scalindua brodae]MBZ0109118.1 branched-chain amino acid ABC transporter permease [Candidatus Scalindua rubra]TWU33554.1 Ribose transport system permease protein RbsC [Candidatus Brocadiaceae bacterium S225]